MSLNFIPRNYITGAGVALGRILVPDGSAAAPSVSFANYPTTGFYTTAGTVNVSTSGSLRVQYNAYQFAHTPAALSAALSFSAQTLAQTWNTTGAPTLVDWTITDTASDAASLAFRIRGGAAGTTTLFSVSKIGGITGLGFTTAATGVFATNYFGWFGKTLLRGDVASGVVTASDSTATGFTTLNLGPTTGNSASGTTSFTHVNATIDMATATGTGTGTITVANFFPAGCVQDGFSGRVTTILAGAGLTTWSIGPTADTDAFGTGLALAANTLVNPTTYTITSTGQVYSAASNLVITAAAGVFSTGVLKVTATCHTFTPIGS